MAWLRRLAVVAAAGGAAAAGYAGLVTGALPLDLGVGRRTRPLGPQVSDILAPRDVIFDVVAQPYLGRATRAMWEKVQVLERGTDMVLGRYRPAGPSYDGGGATAPQTTMRRRDYARPAGALRDSGR